ncbi:MAG: methyltransferase domain-containing protein [Deltaproteobacteria bacterium]|nr:methyltransferase domain-containing protein [Deltaproteobacteria bacterium]MBW2415422.1 methyltransferase domain-containing protein [Deltaproteobacteria bacterium]
MTRRVERPGVRDGYDRWSETYDATPNPVVAVDRRHTLTALAAEPGERVLDAGCGTGFHLGRLAEARVRCLGLDFSSGMLRQARRTAPAARLAQADLNGGFPVRPGAFDALVASLVSEHLVDLRVFFAQAFAALRSGGRIVLSAFHPDLARAGIEANFERDGIEYRLGAARHTVDDYLNQISDAGFVGLGWQTHAGDARLVDEIPSAREYLGEPLILLVQARTRD